MTRKLVAVSALAALALVACGPAETPAPAAPEPEPEPATAAEPTETDSTLPARGDYTCRITLAGDRQPESTCVISQGDVPDSLWLETVGGDMWIEGELISTGESSFELAGDMFCPQGACDEPIDARFSGSSPGAYEARVDTSMGELVIELTR